jgi:hypothetical protein
MDRWAKPNPSKPDHGKPDDGGLPSHDRRSRAQRHADALGLALGLALGAATTTEPDRPHVMIHVGEGGSGDLSQAWVGRFLCDATVEVLRKGPRGEVLNLGRKARTAPPALRRALIGRDRTCAIPNCAVPAHWCDAHHAHWWEKGGATNVADMAMACGPHHADIHADIWKLEMRHGIPWAKPPKWLDPGQRWRRNTYRQHLGAAEQLSIHLGKSDTG